MPVLRHRVVQGLGTTKERMMDTSTTTPPASASLMSAVLGDDFCGLPHLIDVATLAGRLGCSRRTVLRRVNAGEIPHYRIFGAIRFDEAEITAWLQNCHVVAQARPGGADHNGDRP